MSGKYDIQIGKYTLQTYCDMDTDGGGWTVIQRRKDGSVDFNQTWQKYKYGFGDLDADFWLGNEWIHRLTSSNKTELRIDIRQWTVNYRGFGSWHVGYVNYANFSVGDSDSKFKLKVSGYSGTTPDFLGSKNNNTFSTYDQDNDDNPHSHLARNWGQAWWLGYDNGPFNCLLNGRFKIKQPISKGVAKHTLACIGSLTKDNGPNNLHFIGFVEMKVRRV